MKHPVKKDRNVTQSVNFTLATNLLLSGVAGSERNQTAWCHVSHGSWTTHESGFESGQGQQGSVHRSGPTQWVPGGGGGAYPTANIACHEKLSARLSVVLMLGMSGAVTPLPNSLN